MERTEGILKLNEIFKFRITLCFYQIKSELARDDCTTNVIFRQKTFVHYLKGKSFNVKWSRVHLFDKEVVYIFYNDIKSASQAIVTKVQLQSKRKERPAALNTVELLRAASKGLSMSPIYAMQIAERLYTQGYISYPRTETTQYPANFDFRSVLSQQTKSPAWGEHCKALLNGDMQTNKKGVVSFQSSSNLWFNGSRMTLVYCEINQ